MREEVIAYQDERGTALMGQLVYDANFPSPCPVVLVAPDWSGCNDFARTQARRLAKLGYAGFAIDVYGEGKTAVATEEKLGLMQPLIDDRLLLRSRMLAALHKSHTFSTVKIDKHKTAAIGFCFGGLCVLDLARSGEEIGGVISFHGLLQAPEKLPPASIKAKILALHGYDDPMVPPTQVEAFAQEMTQAGADWQIHLYGHTQHAFTNPLANDPKSGMRYNPVAEQRAFLAMENFLTVLFPCKREG